MCGSLENSKYMIKKSLHLLVHNNLHKAVAEPVNQIYDATTVSIFVTESHFDIDNIFKKTPKPFSKNFSRIYFSKMVFFWKNPL